MWNSTEWVTTTGAWKVRPASFLSYYFFYGEIKKNCINMDFDFAFRTSYMNGTNSIKETGQAKENCTPTLRIEPIKKQNVLIFLNLARLLGMV